MRAFAHFGGVPARVAYDNLQAGGARILVGGERALTPRFAALASHYLLEPCFCRPGEGHDKGGVEARGKALRSRRWCRFRAGRRWTRSMRRCSRGSMRASTPRRAGARRSARFVEEQRVLRLVPTPFVAGGDDAGDGHAARAVRARGARLLGAVSLGRARSGRARRREDGHDRRPRRARGSPPAQAASASGRSTTGTICRSSRASRRPCDRCSRICCAIWARRSRRCGRTHAAHGPARGRAALGQILGELDTRGARGRRPALGPRSRPATPLLLALTPARRAAPSLEAVPAPLRDIEVASGCAADYDGWLPEGRMSARRRHPRSRRGADARAQAAGRGAHV